MTHGNENSHLFTEKAQNFSAGGEENGVVFNLGHATKGVFFYVLVSKFPLFTNTLLLP